MSKPLVLVDGSSYFFRAFHALPSLMTSKGQHTGAIYGVLNMVKKLIKDFNPEHIAIIFDAKGNTFRNDWYPEYKANRPPMPDDLTNQFQYLIDCLNALGLPVIIVEGVEADDVIGTLTKQALALNMSVVISTSDKDMAQLVNEDVMLINTMSQQTLDIEGVKKKFNVAPEQFIDYLTLIGDSSDNIPGVPKCGPKTAVKWMHDYNTLDNIIANANAIGGKIGENLRAAIPDLGLYKKLITIKTDVDLDIGVKDLVLKSQDKSTLLTLVKELEFKNLLKELLNSDDKANGKGTKGIQDTNTKNAIDEIQRFILVVNDAQLDELLTALKYAKVVSFEISWQKYDASQENIDAISLVIENGESYCLLFNADNNLNVSSVLIALQPFFTNQDIVKIGYNLKDTYMLLAQYDISLEGNLFDVMLESYVLNPSASRHDFDSLSLVYLGNKPQELVKDKSNLAEVMVSKARANLALHNILYLKLDKDLRDVLLNIDIPLIKVLADMQCHGVLLDCETLLEHGNRLKKQIELLSDEAYELAGRSFNLNSPKQLQEILFNELNLPIISKTQKGQPSTQESVLQELANHYRLPAVIIQHRSLTKLVSTYIDALPKKINPQTQRVHTSYNQAVTATGRLSSTDPNLQNIPIRTEEGRLIRTAFIAPCGYKILAADYSQIELRVMAHIAQDKTLLNAFAMGWDIHAATASELFGVDIEHVTSEQRRQAKVVNFGLIYGMSAYGLASRLKLTQEHAKSYVQKYFERFPGVKQYMEKTRKDARAKGYVETIFKRRLYLPEINSQNRMRQMAAERAAINAPMQGTAADIIKKAMLDFDRLEDKQTLKMIMQVHDELVFEVREDKIQAAQELIKNFMENTVALSVPLIVSIGVGNNWDEAH